MLFWDFRKLENEWYLSVFLLNDGFMWCMWVFIVELCSYLLVLVLLWFRCRVCLSSCVVIFWLLILFLILGFLVLMMGLVFVCLGVVFGFVVVLVMGVVGLIDGVFVGVVMVVGVVFIGCIMLGSEL